MRRARRLLDGPVVHLDMRTLRAVATRESAGGGSSSLPRQAQARRLCDGLPQLRVVQARERLGELRRQGHSPDPDHGGIGRDVAGRYLKTEPLHAVARRAESLEHDLG